MLQRFRDYIIENSLLRSGEKLLVAVSGGVDSVVLSRLLVQCGYEIGIAHCNFQLREEESEMDEKFVEQLATTLKVPFYLKRFDTLAYVDQNKISIQMAARELRYDWFNFLLEQYGYDLILTAHHGNDVLESVLLNLVRGTGIAGFHGIQARAGKLVRPLIFASKKEILEYALENHFPFREDSSNFSDKYNRNLIRNKVVPLLEKINPNLVKTFQQTTEKVTSAELALKNHVEEFRRKFSFLKNGCVNISIEDVVAAPGGAFLLFESIAEFGFSWDDVKNLMHVWNEGSGKIFISKSHELFTDRKSLIIRPRQVKSNLSSYFQEDESLLNTPFFMLRKTVLNKIPSISEASPFTAFLDFDKLTFPLLLRNWEQGDRFMPLGMKGSKKISDFLIDRKIPVPDKERIFVLLSGGEIVWLINHRMDDRFKITSGTKTVLKIETVNFNEPKIM